jgi:hypothetical protein
LPRLLRLFVVAAVLLAANGAARGADDNILRRDQGIVTYEASGTKPPQSLTGSVAVGDAVIATTAIASLATLQLTDSSEIRIGDRTTVRVADLRGAAAATPSGGSFVLTRGAVRFNIVHPTGSRANYRFVTPTSQLAVRGTLGYFISGPGGDQVYCVRCEDGDVSVVVAGQTYTVRSGQTLNALTVGGQRTTAIVPNRTINNPAIDQFLGGVSPFGESSANGSDPTSSGSGRRP